MSPTTAVALAPIADRALAGTELITNDSAEIEVELDPGEYTYICTPHETAGMTGTLTVT